jgi:hypothetical protein
MAFVATISQDSALQVDNIGSRRIERWTATALTNDAGTGTITPKYLQKIDFWSVDSFGGSAPTSVFVIAGNPQQLVLKLPGSGQTALQYEIEIHSRF